MSASAMIRWIKVKATDLMLRTGEEGMGGELRCVKLEQQDGAFIYLLHFYNIDMVIFIKFL